MISVHNAKIIGVAQRSMKMATMQEQEKEIIKYIEENPVEVAFGYRDSLDKEQIRTIIEKEEGLQDIEDDLWELNIDYINEMEDQLLQNIKEEFTLKEDLFDIREFFLEHIDVTIGIRHLLNNTPDIDCVAIVYSNYDCATSFQVIEDKESYLGAVWDRVKAGCLLPDYLNEHANSYTASLLCFAFKMSVLDFAELKRSFKESITIPKGTQYGFFSSFNGSGSFFEARTVQDMTLPKLEPNQSEYDCIGVIADIEQYYSMEAVYGGIIIDNQNITTK